MNFEFSKKSNAIEGGIFNILNEKKKDLLNRGMKVFNFSIGTPDFQPAPHIMEAMQEACKDPQNYKYAIDDKPELLQAMADYYKSRFGVTLENNEIMTVYGSQEGMAHLGWAMCDPGDLVLVPNPGYPIFSVGPTLCDAEVYEYPIYPEDHYILKFENIPEEIAKKAKMIVVSYPLNPVCAVGVEVKGFQPVRTAEQFDEVYGASFFKPPCHAVRTVRGSLPRSRRRLCGHHPGLRPHGQRGGLPRGHQQRVRQECLYAFADPPLRRFRGGSERREGILTPCPRKSTSFSPPPREIAVL